MTKKQASIKMSAWSKANENQMENDLSAHNVLLLAKNQRDRSLETVQPCELVNSDTRSKERKTPEFLGE